LRTMSETTAIRHSLTEEDLADVETIIRHYALLLELSCIARIIFTFREYTRSPYTNAVDDLIGCSWVISFTGILFGCLVEIAPNYFGPSANVAQLRAWKVRKFLLVWLRVPTGDLLFASFIVWMVRYGLVLAGACVGLVAAGVILGLHFRRLNTLWECMGHRCNGVPAVHVDTGDGPVMALPETRKTPGLGSFLNTSEGISR